MLKKIWYELPHREHPFFRFLHVTIAILILSQILNSNFFGRDSLEKIGLSHTVILFHIISGFILIVLGSTMMIWMFTQRGFRYYFAWLFADFKGIKDDLKTLRKLNLPCSHSGGIASTIQGLGVVSLLVVALSGVLWFLFNYFSLFSSVDREWAIQTHKFLTTFIEIYLYAHGTMGILHLGLRYYRASKDLQR